ncbi:hypothetical protein TREMEDRAFT_45618 [Tremella mesenterica DSM 1558]|uniref:uncharacterized protein n=1 Tax=Tremella mesenterica (strain ATCC 24925 / CBS 8224 / DSM 1558 / NBRC 9311 / NRRL Y-6157 / RJB 2259-6 / UBC 559-6) TaxID=578456 RepID=UPI00032C5740|nr:uncharacterized protein TREMEDRAFT_45618 [Tremella mesenterica DSM 1558]EIW66796.1 hypothetical protein TREMEDRAFT_45618 [Tremella mesenterica DSM 1558]
MHIALITQLALHLFPSFHPSRQSPPSLSQPLTFRPIHAHSHSITNLTQPTLLLHDPTSSQSLVSPPSLYPLSEADQAVYLLDNPSPDLAAVPLTVRTRPMTIRRPRDRPPHILSWAWAARNRRTRSLGINSTVETGWLAPDYADQEGEWDDVEVMGPDVRDRQTLMTLAKMASNAYVLPDGGEWYPLGEQWNASTPIGWEPDADGLRGHVFADPNNETVIIALKGTSAGVFGIGGPTAKNDKFNDNLLFSCCCARVDFSWSTVCDCYSGGYRCEQQCLEDALVSDSVYATVGTNLYNNITYMYPNATIWLVGHSLGGAVSAMIGLSFGVPVVTYEAPGERLPAERLHLPLPPGMPSEKTGITHLYHTADPIPMGACTGGYSGCYAAGFALESKCHTGQTILYDTVTVKGWSVDVRTHRIGEVINKLLAEPWPGTENDTELKHGGVPKQAPETECVDCFKWEFGHFEK